MNKITAEFTLCFAFCFFLEAIDNVVSRKRSKLYRITHLIFSTLNVAGIVYMMVVYHIY